MKNRNGFTIIELMGVLIIIVLVTLMGINVVSKSIEKSRMDSFVIEANSIKKAAVNRYMADKGDAKTKKSHDAYNGTKDGKVCYNFKESLMNSFVEKSDAKDYSGSVEVCYGRDCTYNTKIWLTNGEYYIEAIDGEVKRSDIKYSFNAENPNACDSVVFYGGSTCTSNSCDYEYSETIKSFIVPVSGLYKLETWGAQGGAVSKDAYNPNGGYGAYSVGYISLNSGDKLYITVGGKGVDVTNSSQILYDGGYNGGGKAKPDGNTIWAPGGGATHISKTNNLLKDVSPSDLIIVSGGGGGAGTYGTNNFGGNAGGIKGNNGTGNCGGAGGTQTVGGNGCGNGRGDGAFGQGGNTTNMSSGGGGGYFGGGTGYTSGSGGGGGSSYIGTPLLSNKAMYCYNCTESSEEATKTISTTCVSDTPTENCAKSGNGYARITYVE